MAEVSRMTEQYFGLERRDSGRIVISGLSVVGETIPELSLGPGKPPDLVYGIENSIFERCEVQPGKFRIQRGVELRNVTFDHVYSSSGITISASAVLDRVVFRGRCGDLWVRPDEKPDRRIEEWADSRKLTTTQMIDISHHEGGEVVLLGVPVEKVKMDPDRHVLIRSGWSDSVEWASLGIPPESFWPIAVQYVSGFGVLEGILSLPSKRGRDYGQTLDEMGMLIDAGVIPR